MIGIIEANIPTTEIIATRERQKVNQKMLWEYNEAVLNIIDKKLADKIKVRNGICFPIFSPKGKKASIAKNGM